MMAEFLKAASKRRAGAAVFSSSTVSFLVFKPPRPHPPATGITAVNSLLHRMALAVARMRHQVFGADRQRPLDFATKRSHRLRAQSFATRSEIDQIIIVDDERIEIVTLANAR